MIEIICSFDTGLSIKSIRRKKKYLQTLSVRFIEEASIILQYGKSSYAVSTGHLCAVFTGSYASHRLCFQRCKWVLFKMFKSIENPVNCELKWLSDFLILSPLKFTVRFLKSCHYSLHHPHV